MCGIFGIVYRPSDRVAGSDIRSLLNDLFCYSQSRGKEASGLLFRSGEDLAIHKSTLSGTRFIKTSEYKNLFKRIRGASQDVRMIIGHARLDTNGSKWDNTNNSPLEYEGFYGIHNGIITNVDQLWAQNPDLKRHRVVDSEVILALFYALLKQGMNEQTALNNIFTQIEGSASVALFSKARSTLTLGTNTGSLYFSEYNDDAIIFASESYILRKIHERSGFFRKIRPFRMRQILPGTSIVIDVSNMSHPQYQGRLVNEIL